MFKSPALFIFMRFRNVAVATCLAAVSLGMPAHGAECPGNPDALGTSRTLVVDPREYPRIGTMQYAETLPLSDREVVLTFDDGPLPKHTKAVLDTLAEHCVKATFFTIGRMARDYPAILQQVHAAGHTIGTHTQNHKLRMNRMPLEEAEAEIDDGIASAAAALGDPSPVAPFLRIPGLLRSQAVEDYLVSKGIMLWSADFPADDWHRISSERVAEIALSRLEAKGRGIMLLHDIQPRTVAALPVILRELKARNYRIVHVVPATAARPKTPTQPWQWRLRPAAPAVVARTPPPLRFSFDVPRHILSDPGSRNVMHRPAFGDGTMERRMQSPIRISRTVSLPLGAMPPTFLFADPLTRPGIGNPDAINTGGLGTGNIRTASGMP